MITQTHYLSTFVTLLVVSILGYYTAGRVNSSGDFAVGSRKMSSYQVSGSIIATIVGGASTIGTAQLAFERGINAMWFTLGASLACLVLGLFMAGPMRRAEVDTVSEFLSQSYGKYAGLSASIITSIAIFIHITGQVLSSVAIMTSMFQIKILLAGIITVLLFVSYILFGGFMGTSVVGIAKTILLYFTLFIGGTVAYRYFNGITGLYTAFPKEPWFNLFSDGIYNGMAQGFSMIVGTVSTQTYLQALFSGKNERESKKGAFLSAFLIPPVGFICTLIGLYMKVANPGILAKEALPTFILTYLNPWIGGIAIATLIISVVGTGAGLTLGIGTMFNRDIYVRMIRPRADNKEQLFVLRLSVLIVSLMAFFIVLVNADSLILQWGFLSMALRGTTIFIPLLAAIYFKEKVTATAGLTAIIVSPIISMIWEFFHPIDIDSIFVGLFVSFSLMSSISIYQKHKDVRAKANV